jgi:diphosphomevalonate decarboxylase
MSLLSPFFELRPVSKSFTWRAPANIAFVKYWGKKGHQVPANPSLSLTLKECYTQTTVEFSESENLAVDLSLSGTREEKFAAKIKTYLESLTELPWLRNVNVRVETKNTFPHGAGIASSASGLAAFALCLTDYLHALSGETNRELFFKRASHLSRLASGSACRSVYGGFTTWGECELPESSDKYATPFLVHPELANLRDTVLVVSAEEKNVSSRAGHDRMKDHAFAEVRFVQARKNFDRTVAALKAGDMDEVGQVLENEALSLHAMMMTSPESYTLLRPNSLLAIEMVRQFRHETKLPLYFTLDAGPNLHLIYPEIYHHKISTFINRELAPLAVKLIDDERGEGPVRC